MTVKQLALFRISVAIITRLYNSYLEACYFAFPQYRTQPDNEHRLRTAERDLCGRDKEQLRLLCFHDKLTLVSQTALDFGILLLVDPLLPNGCKLFPGPNSSGMGAFGIWYWVEQAGRVVLNHYILSFNMYWMHRLLHVNQWLWRKIHSTHHFSKHPLSRNTYEDHWMDNFMNAIVGHLYAQILCPLGFEAFLFSRYFRVFESLEKHSGISCHLNCAHWLQYKLCKFTLLMSGGTIGFFPYAQMPHHHDWHHEGFKGSNYTFTSLGGFWDWLFLTRAPGRSVVQNQGSKCNKEGGSVSNTSFSVQSSATAFDDIMNSSADKKSYKSPISHFGMSKKELNNTSLITGILACTSAAVILKVKMYA